MTPHRAWTRATFARAAALRAIGWAIALACAAACAGGARAQEAAPDSLHDLFRQLSDSTDAAYGQASVAYDTTGFDSLAAFGFDDVRSHRPRRGERLAFSPILRFHRAEGPVLGAGMAGGNTRAGMFKLEGAYGFANKGGRYGARWRKPLFYGGPPTSERRSLEEPRLMERRTELDLGLHYARATLSFMPEHARPGAGSPRALLFGKDRHSVYESRGFDGGLTLWAGDWRLIAGYEDGRDRAMERVTRFSLLGNRDSVPANQAAAPDRYRGPIGGVAFYRSDWELAARIDGRAGGEDRWRLHGALGKAVRLGSSWKTFAQVEAGAAAALASPQRRFQVGGPRLLPTFHTGTGSADHLLGGKLELVSSLDVKRALGLQRPDWLVLNPWFVAESAALWDDPGARNVVFSKPPRALWRSAAGGGFVFKPGVPDPETWVRIGYTVPVGPEGGAARLTFSIDRAFDLVGKL